MVNTLSDSESQMTYHYYSDSEKKWEIMTKEIHCGSQNVGLEINIKEAMVMFSNPAGEAAAV